MKKRNIKALAIAVLIGILILTIFIPLIEYINYGTFSYNKNRKEGWFSIYYNNGILKCKILIEDGKLLKIKNYHGIRDNIIDIGNFKDGNGYLKIYSSKDGDLQEEGNIKEGLKDGMWINHKYRDTIYYYKGRSSISTYPDWKDAFEMEYIF